MSREGVTDHFGHGHGAAVLFGQHVFLDQAGLQGVFHARVKLDTLPDLLAYEGHAEVHGEFHRGMRVDHVHLFVPHRESFLRKKKRYLCSKVVLEWLF